jgi:hypothetical protein
LEYNFNEEIFSISYLEHLSNKHLSLVDLAAKKILEELNKEL